MMFNSRHLLLVLTAAVVFAACAACAATAGNAPAKNMNANANANVATLVAAAPTADALLALERRANEAYVNHKYRPWGRTLPARSKRSYSVEVDANA